MSGKAVERRWIEHNGDWRLFKITDDDPRYADSQPWTSGEGAPTRTLAQIKAGDDEQDDDAADPAVKVANKARTTGPVTSARAGRGGGRGRRANPPATGDGAGDPPADGE
jgi:hypothetical protein